MYPCRSEGVLYKCCLIYSIDPICPVVGYIVRTSSRLIVAHIVLRESSEHSTGGLTPITIRI